MVTFTFAFPIELYLVKAMLAILSRTMTPLKKIVGLFLPVPYTY